MPAFFSVNRPTLPYRSPAVPLPPARDSPLRSQGNAHSCFALWGWGSSSPAPSISYAFSQPFGSCSNLPRALSVPKSRFVPGSAAALGGAPRTQPGVPGHPGAPELPVCELPHPLQAPSSCSLHPMEFFVPLSDCTLLVLSSLLFICLSSEGVAVIPNVAFP